MLIINHQIIRFNQLVKHFLGIQIIYYVKGLELIILHILQQIKIQILIRINFNKRLWIIMKLISQINR